MGIVDLKRKKGRVKRKKCSTLEGGKREHLKSAQHKRKKGGGVNTILSGTESNAFSICPSTKSLSLGILGISKNIQASTWNTCS